MSRTLLRCISSAAILLLPVTSAWAQPEARPLPDDTAPVRQTLPDSDLREIDESLKSLVRAVLKNDPQRAGQVLAKDDRERILNEAPEAFAQLDGQARGVVRSWELRFGNMQSAQPLPLSLSDKPTKDRATVKLPAAHGLPEVTLQVVKEEALGDSWKVDIPNEIDADELFRSLRQTLLTLGEGEYWPEHWPKELGEATARVAQEVLMPFNVTQSAQRETPGTAGQARGRLGAPEQSQGREDHPSGRSPDSTEAPRSR